MPCISTGDGFLCYSNRVYICFEARTYIAEWAGWGIGFRTAWKDEEIIPEDVPQAVLNLFFLWYHEHIRIPEWHRDYKNRLMEAGFTKAEAEDCLLSNVGNYNYEDDPEDVVNEELSHWTED